MAGIEAGSGSLSLSCHTFTKENIMFRFVKPILYAAIALVSGTFAYKEGKEVMFPTPSSEQTVDVKPTEDKNN